MSVSLLLILTGTQSRVCTDNPFNKHLGRVPLGCRLRTEGLMNHSELSIVCKCMCLFCSLACMCHSFHYVKRILETIFVHRISHGTMPLRNIFKVNELIKPYIQTSVLSCINLPGCADLQYISVLSRTVAIIGAMQHGWHITSTTLSTQHPVSPTQRDSWWNINMYSHVNNLLYLWYFVRLWRAAGENRTVPFLGKICFGPTF